MPKKSPTPDFGYKPERKKEMQDFFKNNDFTANFSLQYKVTLTGAKAEIFGKAKYAFTKYWLDNLPGLGIKRQIHIRKSRLSQPCVKRISRQPTGSV